MSGRIARELELLQKLIDRANEKGMIICDHQFHPNPYVPLVSSHPSCPNFVSMYCCLTVLHPGPFCKEESASLTPLVFTLFQYLEKRKLLQQPSYSTICAAEYSWSDSGGSRAPMLR
ncbi:hypothetical protein HAX54_020406 [Datura stramonium]|uniref:NERD domain-containing protein n=1 Tax=Datura stramonium TaxID=4076 RepID=A0ABS8US78_DATST|nr:hypothetical protein [Datura stramonium]